MADYNAVPAVLQPAPESSTPLALIGGFAPKSDQPPQLYTCSEVTKNAVWDWYQASFEADPDQVIKKFCEDQGCIPEQTKPQPPYLYGVAFCPIDKYGQIDTKNPLATLHYGGVNDKLMIRVTSVEADMLTPYLRKSWPKHQVSRADMALDVDQEGIFEEWSAWLIKYAKANRLKTGFAGDWANGSQGRTLYVGSRKSAVFIRLYEKGHEQIQKGSRNASVDWVRFEAEIKPQNKPGKTRLATIAPHQCFGVSKLTREFAQYLGGAYTEIKVTKGMAEKSSDPMRHLAKQYGKTLADYLAKSVAEHGYEGAVKELLAMIDQEAETRAITSEKLAERRRTAGGFWVVKFSAPGPLSPLAPLRVFQYQGSLLGRGFQPVGKASALH